MQCVCPERRDAQKTRLCKGRRGGSLPRFDAAAYIGRNVVERAINRLKDFSAVATRYEKRGHNFFAAVIVAQLCYGYSKLSQIHPRRYAGFGTS